MKNDKANVFVNHIENHLKEMFEPKAKAKVCCRICGKTIDHIWKWRKKK